MEKQVRPMGLCTTLRIRHRMELQDVHHLTYMPYMHLLTYIPALRASPHMPYMHHLTYMPCKTCTTSIINLTYMPYIYP